MWAKGCGVVEQVPVGSPCNALTWFRKLDWLDAEEMLCLARNKFPLSRSLLMVCVVESVIFAIVPPAIPPGEARLGPWQLHRAYLPCSPCLSVCIQTWVPGMWAQAEWLNDLAVYIMWPRPELFCCTPRSIAITLLAIHILGVRPTSPCSSHLLPTQGSCFQLDSEWKKGALIFHTSARGCLQCLLTFRIIEQRSWVSPGSQASRRCVAAPIANAAVLLQGFCLGENFHVLPQDKRAGSGPFCV